MRHEKILLGLSDILLGHMNRIAKEEKIPRAKLIRDVLQNFVIERDRAKQRCIDRENFLKALKADRKRDQKENQSVRSVH